MHAARHLIVLWRPDGLPPFVREDGDEATVAGIEVEVALGVVVEVRLLEHERHAEHALPELDRRLALRSDERDVVDALGLDLPHQRETSLDLYSLRCKLPKGTSWTSVWTTRTSRSLPRIAAARPASGAASRASSTATGSGGSCLTPSPRGLTRMLPLTAGSKALTTSRTADGKTLTPRTISMSSVRPRQRTRGVVRPHAQRLAQTWTWSRVRNRRSGAARWRRCVRTSSPVAPSSHARAAPVSGSISSGCTRPCAPRCMPDCSWHSPHSDGPMSPIPIASGPRAFHPSSAFAREGGP